MHAVSQAILDVAWAGQRSPPALNLVHPRPISWNAIVSVVNEAMVEEGIITSKLPLITYQDWFSRLDERSNNPSEDDFKAIVSGMLRIIFGYTDDWW